MNSDAKELFLEVNHLHDSNVANAYKTAENAIKLGIILHQIKETVGHGPFLSAMAEHAPSISERCCRNYMRLACERLIEEKARLLIPETTKMPTEGKSATVADLDSLIAPSSPISPMPENSLPSDAYESARKEVDSISWVKLPEKIQQTLYKDVHGKDLMELFRNYGIVRAKELKVYNPPKALTPDEQIAAENEQAEAILESAERAFDAILMDLNAKTSILAARIAPKRFKEFLRRAVTVNKRLRPLAQRKLSPKEKKAESNSVAIKKRWEAAKAKGAAVQPLKPEKHAFTAYVNRWGSLVIQNYDFEAEIEALKSPSVYAVIRHVEAETLEEARTEAARRYRERHCDITFAGKGQKLPIELKH